MVYFISGHRDLTEKEFKLYYHKYILNYILKNNLSDFIVGDYFGCDRMAIDYLYSLKQKYKGISITIYHIGDNCSYNPYNFKTKGGFLNDHDRDSHLTLDSDVDIAWIRSGYKYSGTSQNILRRKVKNMINTMSLEESKDYLQALVDQYLGHKQNINAKRLKIHIE
jgi:hypothetical protein